MRPAGVFLALILLAGCTGDSARVDAASSSFDCSFLLANDATRLIVRDGTRCFRCDPRDEARGDVECAALAGSLAAGCRAYCHNDGTAATCMQACAGECADWNTPDAAACVPGGRQCDGVRGAVYICDPACRDSGGCKRCAFDDECVGELGPGAVCARHCGTCCNVSGNADARVACNCI